MHLIAIVDATLLALEKSTDISKRKGWMNFKIILTFCANVRAVILSILFI